MPNLDLLLTFLEIYRTGSLSAAAQRLGVTQPAVSGQLARLEEQLGEPLFVRSRKGVAPTQRAVALAARVGLHVDELRGALDSTDVPPALRGTVRVGGAAEVMSLRVLPALCPLTRRGLCVHATLGLADDLLSLLVSGRLDLVVSAVRPTDEALLAVPLIDEEFVLVAPPAMAHTVDRERLEADPAEALAHIPVIGYAEELPILRRYWRTEFGRRPPNPVTMIVSDLRAVLAVVAAGAGISVLPRYIADPALAAGDVVQLHQPEVAPLNTLYLATRRGAPANPALTVLRDHLQRAAQEWNEL
ncbi:LysR family transcriptional regulator [Streptomyces sp. DASNCL29]|uniref:LysR family transcriptional regulator n=1 Tax=Streptomyces sp. DASNCL29 TaxID=2583819 RepID=UPI00110FD340|nr:LysR family transcriptional regulator [Streptomyces sp. DASNCL29]TMU98706.1 LysR family transcriptional regulator [Streptomyces sp. DASNCL29]